VNPLLQILGANPEIVTSDTPNIINMNSTPITGDAVDIGGNPVKFEDLLIGIEADIIDNNEPIEDQTINKNIALQIVQNPENGVVLFNNMTGPGDLNAEPICRNDLIPESEPSLNIEDDLSAPLKLASESELEKLLVDNRTNPLKAIPVDLLTKQNPESGKNPVLLNVSKAEPADILFQTNIHNLTKTDQLPGNDIFSQKLNVLNLKQVDLIENGNKVSTRPDVSHKLSTEKTEPKSLFDIPTLTRLFPAEPVSDEGNKTKSTPNLQMAAPHKEESNTTEAIVRPAAMTTDNAGDGKTGNMLTNNFESGKETGDVSTKTNNVHFAKTLGGEMLTTQANNAAKATSTPSQPDSTNVRFVMPDKLLENGAQNNRTITIKMEPEHLGTIRLTLSSAHHGLTGRMVVDNASTHAIVQSNIDHLFSELSDKGIKLDTFSISVGVDTGKEKSTQERRPFRMNNRGGNDKNISRLESIKPAAVELRSSHMYVGSNGVNWLA
jgi:flagellar hook-length control protein FliK